MRFFVVGETDSEETRAAMLPADVGRLAALGANVEVEAGLGRDIDLPDQAYEQAGAKVSSNRTASLEAEIVARIGVPTKEDIGHLSKEAIHISLLDPFNQPEAIEALAAAGVSAISLNMMPRSTIAQKMDVLSSQANLAGYVAVILAAARHKKLLPMMMTPAGTISPARVFVIGAGVAGLQAIATAKRLGARVDAFDVRPEAQEQILSLGAKPLKIDLGETGQTKEGYAMKPGSIVGGPGRLGPPGAQHRRDRSGGPGGDVRDDQRRRRVSHRSSLVDGSALPCGLQSKAYSLQATHNAHARPRRK